jgi:hypothetical protein
MKLFTVVLLRPDYVADDDANGFGQDVYVAFVKSRSPKHALNLAQKEVFKADSKDEREPNDPDDYALIVMFEGHHNPILWGWQL